MAAYAITYLSSLPVAVGVRKRAKQKKKKIGGEGKEKKKEGEEKGMQGGNARKKR